MHMSQTIRAAEPQGCKNGGAGGGERGGGGLLTIGLMQGLGYAVSVGGFLLYNYIKMQKGPATRNTTPTKHGNYAAVAHTDAEAQKGAA